MRDRVRKVPRAVQNADPRANKRYIRLPLCPYLSILEGVSAEFLSLDYFKNPYETFQDFLLNKPVFWDEKIKAWIISPYSEVEKGLSNSDLNAGERIASASAHLSVDEKREFSKIISTLNNWIVFQDPPSHTRLRKLVNKSFTPRSIAAFTPKLERIVDDLVSQALTKKEFDLVSELSYRSPAIVI